MFNFGYWSFSDACIGGWYCVFNRIKKRFEEGDCFTYGYQYPDQGEPKLEFVFKVDDIVIRTTFYTDDSWIEVEEMKEQQIARASFEDFILKSINLIENEILDSSQKVAKRWLKRNKQ